MRDFWIILPVALALAAPPAFAGKLASVEQAAKTYLAKKENGNRASHGLAGGKAGTILSKGKKLLGK